MNPNPTQSNPTVETIVIYHSADFDGIFCREIARKFLPVHTQFLGWDFGDNHFCFDELSRKDVTFYVMDLPVFAPFGLEIKHGWLCDRGGSRELQPLDRIDWANINIIWIDHHKSSIESHPTNIPGYRIDGVAACRLAWQWFDFHTMNNDKSLPAKEDFTERRVVEPYAVRLAGEYDVFDRRDANAELFQFGLRSQPLTDSDWRTLLDYPYSHVHAQKLLEQGLVLAHARREEYREVILQQGFVITWEGIKFLCCNSHELDIRSQLFDAAFEHGSPFTRDIQALLGFTRARSDWRVSMYGAPGGPDIDLSEIAKKYGGGGHRKACGFRCKTLPFPLDPPLVKID